MALDDSAQFPEEINDGVGQAERANQNLAIG